ncbi:unnamed protein product, partial [Polarella glacialis]
VRRQHLLSDFCGQLWWRLCNLPQCLSVPLSVVFVGELGIDAGGLRKECLQLVLRQLCELTSLFTELEELPGLLWFKPTADYWNKGFIPQGDEGHDIEWSKHLPEIAGAIVGLAAFNSIYLDLRLHPSIYRFFVQRSVQSNFEDLRAMHPTLHRSLVSLKKADIRSMELSWSVRLPGASTDVDLSRGEQVDPVKPGLELEQFASAYAEAALVGGVRFQLEGFVRTAVAGMAVGPAYSLCSAHDLELLVCGLPDIGNFRELEASCTYSNGLTAESATVRFFWQVVHEMAEIWKRKLLLFCTGSDRVPILGLKALGFVVSYSSADLDHLPT